MRGTEDSATGPRPALQSHWVSETSRRKKVRLSGATADGLSDDNSGPVVPRSHFSAPEEQADWTLPDTAEDGPPVPRSSFA